MSLSIFDIEIAWLAGIVDGEGCIGIFLQGTNQSKRRRPRVSISNTDPGIIGECTRLLEVLGITYSIVQQRGVNKTVRQIEVNRVMEVLQLCRILKPYLRSTTRREKVQEIESLVENSDWAIKE